MFLFTRENIKEQSTRFKFFKLVDCITVLQSFDFIIYGSCVYEYIWRCAMLCLPWKKFGSLRRLVQDRDVRINNINGYFRSAAMMDAASVGQAAIAHFQRTAFVNEPFFQIKVNNFSEFELTFDNPFDDLPFRIAVELASPATNNLWVCDDLISLIALDKNGFTLYKETPTIKQFLETSLNIKIHSFYDAQLCGVLYAIGEKIARNETVVMITETDHYTAMGVARIRSLVAKGYTTTWNYKGVKVVIPRARVEEKCAICLEEEQERGFQGLVVLPCGHEYHLTCIASWARVKNASNCPLCRTPFASKAIKIL